MFDDTKAYMPTSNAAWIYWYSLSSLVYTKYRIYLEYISMLTYFRIVLEKYLKHMILKWNDPKKSGLQLQLYLLNFE